MNSNNAVLLIARVLLSILFIVAGFGKLTAAAGFAGMLGGMGFPSPLALAYLTGACELVGGLCVLLGFQVRIVGPLLAIFCLFTGYVAHLGDATSLMKNIALAGGYLALAATGAGAYSLERKARVSAYA